MSVVKTVSPEQGGWREVPRDQRITGEQPGELSKRMTQRMVTSEQFNALIDHPDTVVNLITLLTTGPHETVVRLAAIVEEVRARPGRYGEWTLAELGLSNNPICRDMEPPLPESFEPVEFAPFRFVRPDQHLDRHGTLTYEQMVRAVRICTGGTAPMGFPHLWWLLNNQDRIPTEEWLSFIEQQQPGANCKLIGFPGTMVEIERHGYHAMLVISVDASGEWRPRSITAQNYSDLEDCVYYLGSRRNL